MASDDYISLGVALEGFSYRSGLHRRDTVLRELGSGSTATVYLCESKSTSVKYAVKVTIVSTGGS